MQIAKAQIFVWSHVPQMARRKRDNCKMIEQYTQPFVERAEGDVFATTGSAFTETVQRIEANGIKLSACLSQLVYDATDNRAWAHWKENRQGEAVDWPMSRQKFVKRTDMELVPRSALQH